MSDAHTTTVDRLRQFSTARRSTALDRLAEAQQTDARARGTLPAGTRVLDLVSGAEGVVTAPLPTLSSPAGLVGVRLDRGDIVTRPASQLLVRPTPPTV
jgi:hypothetical protein